jgi:tetratricopeptide (TPR) repeat protein/DNA-binding transcriptional regulator YiaG
LPTRHGLDRISQKPAKQQSAFEGRNISLALKKAAKASVNEKLTQARLESNWTQEYVAGQIGTSGNLVSRWERGITVPGPYNRKKLCGLYGKSEAELGLAKEVISSNIEQPQQISHEQVQQSQNLWNMPYKRPPFFTGREGVLQDLYDKFRTANSSVVVLAISGLGGIGKTLTAIEYAYRYRSSYKVVLWANAETYDTLASDYVKMASKNLLDLPEKEEQNLALVIAAIKRRLSDYEGWLLVFDNVVDLSTIGDFIPQTGKGHLLLTTRDQVVGDEVDHQIKLDKMELEESILFLLRRAKILPMDASPDMALFPGRDAAKAISIALDHLPLALDQAGAYIEETQCSLTAYLHLYETQHTALLKRRGRLAIRYRETVATTWSLSFQRVERANSVAADLLRLFAFLHADGIPEEILITCSQDLGSILEGIDNPLALDQAIEELLKYSLVHRHADNQTLGIHRLVQTVLKDSMSKNQQREWAERAVLALERVFPVVKFATLPRCERYFPHAQACAILIERWDMVFVEAAHLLRRVGEYLRERSQFIQAQHSLQQALTICERLPEPQLPELANCLNGLATLHEIQENFVDAEALNLKTLAICERILKPEDPQFIHLLNSIALLYIKQYKLSKAEPLIQHVSNIIKDGQGVDPVAYIYSLNIRAELYAAKGQYAEVEDLYLQALSLREQLLGSEHPDLASVLNNLAVLYMSQGKFLAAEPICQRALALSEKAWGSRHHTVAFHLTNLAAINAHLGRFTEAEQMYQRSLEIRKETLGVEHPEVGSILNNLGLLYNKQGKFAEAEMHFKRALAIREKVRGPEHPEVAYCLTNLAELYQKQGKFDEIESLCQRALSIISASLGTEHPDMRYGLNNLAAFYKAKGEYARAEPLYQKALAIMQKTLGPEHPDTARVLWWYADLIKKLGREDEASELERRFNLIKAKYLENPKKYF